MSVVAVLASQAAATRDAGRARAGDARDSAPPRRARSPSTSQNTGRREEGLPARATPPGSTAPTLGNVTLAPVVQRRRAAARCRSSSGTARSPRRAAARARARSTASASERVTVADDGSLVAAGKAVTGPLLVDTYGSTVRLSGATPRRGRADRVALAARPRIAAAALALRARPLPRRLARRPRRVLPVAAAVRVADDAAHLAAVRSARTRSRSSCRAASRRRVQLRGGRHAARQPGGLRAGSVVRDLQGEAPRDDRPARGQRPRRRCRRSVPDPSACPVPEPVS